MSGFGSFLACFNHRIAKMGAKANNAHHLEPGFCHLGPLLQVAESSGSSWIILNSLA